MNNARRIVTGALLGFVLLSVGFLMLRSLRAAKEWRSVVAAQAAAGPSVPESAPARGQGKIIAYYFHVNVRCATCRAIENYSKEVIHTRFAKELAAGQLEWRLVNVQHPEHRHFIQDYQLYTKSLVVVRTENGEQKEFKVLNGTWELVGDKTVMQNYVEQEVRRYLGKLK